MRNFFKIQTTWSTMELGLIKLCLACLWVSAGAYFHEYLIDYIWLFLPVFFVTGIWLWYLWIKKIKANEK